MSKSKYKWPTTITGLVGVEGELPSWVNVSTKTEDNRKDRAYGREIVVYGDVEGWSPDKTREFNEILREHKEEYGYRLQSSYQIVGVRLYVKADRPKEIISEGEAGGLARPIALRFAEWEQVAEHRAKATEELENDRRYAEGIARWLASRNREAADKIVGYERRMAGLRAELDHALREVRNEIDGEVLCRMLKEAGEEKDPPERVIKVVLSTMERFSGVRARPRLSTPAQITTEDME